MSKNPVVHFEMPYEDSERVAAFYSQAFGWSMNNLGDQMGGYITAGTADTDANNMVQTPGTINGGLYALKDAPDKKEPSVVISVDDLTKAIENVKNAGGTLLNEPTEIPGIGMWASFRDTEGNRASILQPNPRG
jgi:predicted enzyme related to lactoylglutathione lyase